MEHLALEIFDLPTPEDPKWTGSQYATLPEDTTITITDTSEIFASGDVWSHSFTLNAAANAHIFGTAADLHGSRLHDQLDRRKARLWVEGLPLYLGYLRLDDEAEVDGEGNVDVRFESGQKTFEEMIEGAKANQVPMMEDVQIGVALWRKRKVSMGLKLSASLVFSSGNPSSSGTVLTSNEEDVIAFSGDGEAEYGSVQEYPRMVFPKGEFEPLTPGKPRNINCLNTDFPYTEDGNGTPTHPFCNVALCYQKQGYEKKNENGELIPDYNSEPERGYELMPADRVNSAPNFFVIYWIRALMKHLGIYVEENQMLGVEDLRRLFFVNTDCAYRMPKHVRTPGSEDSWFGRYRFKDVDNKLQRLVPERFEYVDEIVWEDGWPVHKTGYRKLVKTDDSGFTATIQQIERKGGGQIPSIERLTVKIKEVMLQDDEEKHEKQDYEDDNCYLHEAFATSECFPDVDISEVIKAIESGFGIRFLFSDDYKRVRIVLLRNLFRSDEIQDIDCEIIAPDVKVENSIRGFRMTYGDSDDTHFFYKGFDDKLPKKKPYFTDDTDKHDYSQWDLNAQYADILHKVTAFNKTCYVTPNTGNAYIVKVDKDAKRYDELYPSLFESAGFMTAEDGICTGEEETVKTITVGFKPAIMNDLNMEEERNGVSKQRFALFVDETMKPRRPALNDGKDYNDPEAYYDVNGELYGKKADGSDKYPGMRSEDGVVKPGEFAVTSDMFAAAKNLSTTVAQFRAGLVEGEYDVTFDIDGHINEGYRLYLQDNYEPNDDGIAPVETHDWGLTLGIMRGSGSDSRVEYGADPDDKEGNDTWELESGSSIAAHPDTCDNYGNLWPYNDGRQRTVSTSADAVAALTELFPDPPRNAAFYKSETGRGYITKASVTTSIPDNTGKEHNYLIVNQYGSYMVDYGQDYIPSWVGKSVSEVLAWDKARQSIIIEVDSSRERCDTLLELCRIARFGTSTPMIIDADGVGSQFGRFSLKLRAEKPNPYFDPTLPSIVTTKEQAGLAMTKLYSTANTDLLNRPTVSNATMRAAGWDCPGDGYATVFSMGYGVEYNDGKVHEILWTPIKENGTVKTPSQMQSYVNGFNGLQESQLAGHDTEHLILDIDTTEHRADVLHQLQAIYYAPAGEVTESVDIELFRYLEVTDPNLRGRGLMDQFYKEYSLWVRKARIAKRPVRMTLAQLLAIDKTKRVRVGDIMGFIRKNQFQVSKKTGLGMVEMEILYI